MFQLGELNNEPTMIKQICSILLLGNKFDYFYFLLKEIDKIIIDFNKYIFFVKKSCNNNNTNNNYITLVNSNDSTVIDDNNFKSILHFLKKKSYLDSNSLFLNKETLEFRRDIYKRLISNYDKIEIKPNISYTQLKYLIKFLKEKTFTIINCDKNVGNALISNDLYQKQTLDYIKNDSSFLLLNYNPLDEVTKRINDVISNLKLNNHISITISNTLMLKENEHKLGNLRLLAKLHKEKFSWRAIINCQDHPTSKFTTKTISHKE